MLRLLVCAIVLALATTPAVAGYSYVTLSDDPSALAGTTTATGINDTEDVVGYYSQPFISHGFTYDGGTWTTVDQVDQGLGNLLRDINDSGLAVGSQVAAPGVIFSFIYDAGSFTSVNDPTMNVDFASTRANGLSNSGLVTGYSTVGSGSFAYGYIKDGSTWTDFNYPGATYTYAYDVNDSGHVVGYLDGGPGTHAFLYDGTTWTLLDDPDAIAGTTQALGINDSGLIVGQFRDSSGYHGFLYDGGTWTTLDDPMSTSSTFAQGINDDGDIVGYFYDATGTHSFIASRAATVPEASTWSLMLCAFAALALVRRRRGVWQLANLARELQQRIEFSTFPAVSLSQVSEVHSFCIVGMLCAPAVLRRSMG